MKIFSSNEEIWKTVSATVSVTVATSIIALSFLQWPKHEQPHTEHLSYPQSTIAKPAIESTGTSTSRVFIMSTETPLSDLDPQ
jgi:hypothetical protein